MDIEIIQAGIGLNVKVIFESDVSVNINCGIVMTGILSITVVNAISIGTDITFRHDLQGFSADDDTFFS
ncbi:hypothetical protein [Neisseria subflava]|uniref:hypothetical protein n=1 Tax=Neisseria subflava TaxID=28449 RepID=UPI0024B0BC9C|nr:hypothetical protein [Neisseria subflava]